MEIKKVNAAALAAIDAATNLGLSICISVLDSGAHAILTLRMDDANFMTIEAARRKAKTAFLFKCPSHVLALIVDKVPKLSIEIEKLPGDAMMIEGGLPIVENGKTIGGVGVSGGNFEQDLAVASAFIEKMSSEYIIN